MRLDPELAEAELLVVLVVQAGALHLEPKGIKVGLADVPQPRVGPGPGQSQGLRLLRFHVRVRREALLKRPLFVEHFRDELHPARLLDAGSSTSRDTSCFRVEVRTKTSVTCASEERLSKKTLPVRPRVSSLAGL